MLQHKTNVREFQETLSRATHTDKRLAVKRGFISNATNFFYVEAYNLLAVQIENTVVVASCARLQA